MGSAEIPSINSVSGPGRRLRIGSSPTTGRRRTPREPVDSPVPRASVHDIRPFLTMSRSLYYGLTGVALAGAAVWILHARSHDDDRAVDPMNEIDRMMAQTRKKVIEIQRNLGEFRQVLAKATALEASTRSLALEASSKDA